MQAKKIMLKEESMNQMVKAQFKDDRFEKKEKVRLSMGLNYAAKGGGLSLD